MKTTWQRSVPTAPGWYWWRAQTESAEGFSYVPVLLKPDRRTTVTAAGGLFVVDTAIFSGEWWPVAIEQPWSRAARPGKKGAGKHGSTN